MTSNQDIQPLWDEYRTALREVGPDGLLGAAVGQDAKYAVNGRVRKAAQALLDAGVSEDAW